MAKVVVFIQARVNSYRLPGKIHLPLEFEFEENTTILELCKKRCKKSGYPVYVLTPNGEGGDFEGPEQDVLERFMIAAKKLNLQDDDLIVRVTADCPLIDPGVIRQAVFQHQFQRPQVEVVTASRADDGYPHGTDVEVFSYNTLRELNACLDPKIPDQMRQREHVTLGFYERMGQFTVMELTTGNSRLGKIDYSVDTVEDYLLVRRAFHKLEYDKLSDDPLSIAAFFEKEYL